jgi:sugar/nucleoside kinase (ribokinase family)
MQGTLYHMSVDLVVLGNLLLDDVVLPDGRTRMGEPGGAVLYASLGASLWGIRVGVVTWKGSDYPAWALEALAARGVDLAGARPLGRSGLRTWLLYEGSRRRVVHHLESPTHEEASPTAELIPESWREARAFHLAPVPFAIQKGLLDSLAGWPDALVTVDPYLPLRADTLPDWREAIEGADVLILGEDEMELEGDPRQLLRALTAGRLRRVLFKQGASGGLAYDAGEDRFHDWQARAVRVVDPTGAGDAFAGGVLAGWLTGEDLEGAIARGVVSASFALEDWGPATLLSATPESARARLNEWYAGSRGRIS